MMQAQTFYFSNMTPQNYSLNQNPWAALEKMARDNWMCSDTLYVVTGAYWNPGSTFATPDIDGKIIFTSSDFIKEGEFVDVEILGVNEYDLLGRTVK